MSRLPLSQCGRLAHQSFYFTVNKKISLTNVLSLLYSRFYFVYHLEFNSGTLQYLHALHHLFLPIKSRQRSLAIMNPKNNPQRPRRPDPGHLALRDSGHQHRQVTRNRQSVAGVRWSSECVRSCCLKASLQSSREKGVCEIGVR